MSQYRNQNQWENDIENSANPVERTIDKVSSVPKEKQILVKKSTLLIAAGVFVAIVVAIVMLYLKAGQIEGTWVRQVDDSYEQGMIVQVTNNDGVLEGVIISSNKTDSIFEPGLVKWASIQKTGFRQYQCFDLTASVRNDKVVNYYYGEGGTTIKVSADGKTLTLTNAYSGEFVTGQNQTWIKVG